MTSCLGSKSQETRFPAQQPWKQLYRCTCSNCRARMAQVVCRFVNSVYTLSRSRVFQLLHIIPPTANALLPTPYLPRGVEWSGFELYTYPLQECIIVPAFQRCRKLMWIGSNLKMSSSCNLAESFVMLWEGIPWWQTQRSGSGHSAHVAVEACI
jgi:hypothetical protein